MATPHIPERSFESWIHDHPIEDAMLWKAAALDQYKRFWELAEALRVNIRAVGSHTSKSIKLPVVELAFPNGRILLRDNFHNVEMAVLWNFAPDVGYADMYQAVGAWVENPDGSETPVHVPADGWTWYLEQIASCEGYSWKGWSGAELLDGRITRVLVTHPATGGIYWNETTPAKKDMWNKRMTDPSWFHKDWSSGRIFTNDTFGPGAKLYVGYNTFLEGIAELIPAHARDIFEKGKKDFTLSADWDNVLARITAIVKAKPIS